MTLNSVIDKICINLDTKEKRDLKLAIKQKIETKIFSIPIEEFIKYPGATRNEIYCSLTAGLDSGSEQEVAGTNTFSGTDMDRVSSDKSTTASVPSEKPEPKGDDEK